MSEDLLADLACAARNLQERLEILQAPCRSIAAPEWSVLTESIRHSVPSWLVILLERYSLVGMVLEYRDRRETYVRAFSFFDPPTFASVLGEDSLGQRLLSFGYLPFASESDGSLWVLPRGDTSVGPVFLLDLPTWNGRQPTQTNGLTFASERLEFMLASGHKGVILGSVSTLRFGPIRPVATSRFPKHLRCAASPKCSKWQGRD